MKQRVALRTKINLDAEVQHLRDLREHVAQLKAEHDSRQDFDFGTKGTAVLKRDVIVSILLQLMY